MSAAHDGVMNIDTIEDLTLYSLDRSLEGLEKLRRDSLLCGDSCLAGSSEGLSSLPEFATKLRDFCLFEQEIKSLFQVDTQQIRDGKGHLELVESGLDKAMQALVERLDKQDLVGVSDLLRRDIPKLLDRFQDLLPALRNHIENEYVLAVN